MPCTRREFATDLSDTGLAELMTLLGPGWWLVEAGARPPAWHSPDALPPCYTRHRVMALSLRAASAMQAGFGPPVLDRLAALGAPVNPHAALALHELMVNAALHGCLEVSSGRSVQWEDMAARERRLAEAMTDPARAGRAVTLALRWENDLEAVVSDEGAGYDIRRRCVETRGAGRGLRLATMAGRLEVRMSGRQTAIVFAAVEAGLEAVA